MAFRPSIGGNGQNKRARAVLMRDPDAKATMLEVSRKYEAMADRETRQEIRHVPD
jgi:hypothetical protein